MIEEDRWQKPSPNSLTGSRPSLKNDHRHKHKEDGNNRNDFNGVLITVVKKQGRNLGIRTNITIKKKKKTLEEVITTQYFEWRFQTPRMVYLDPLSTTLPRIALFHRIFLYGVYTFSRPIPVSSIFSVEFHSCAAVRLLSTSFTQCLIYTPFIQNSGSGSAIFQS